MAPLTRTQKHQAEQDGQEEAVERMSCTQLAHVLKATTEGLLSLCGRAGPKPGRGHQDLHRLFCATLPEPSLLRQEDLHHKSEQLLQ